MYFPFIATGEGFYGDKVLISFDDILADIQATAYLAGFSIINCRFKSQCFIN